MRGRPWRPAFRLLNPRHSVRRSAFTLVSVNRDNNILVVSTSLPPFATAEITDPKTRFVVQLSNEYFVKCDRGFRRGLLVDTAHS